MRLCGDFCCVAPSFATVSLPFWPLCHLMRAVADLRFVYIFLRNFLFIISFKNFLLSMSLDSFLYCLYFERDSWLKMINLISLLFFNDCNTSICYRFWFLFAKVCFFIGNSKEIMCFFAFSFKKCLSLHTEIVCIICIKDKIWTRIQKSKLYFLI